MRAVQRELTRALTARMRRMPARAEERHASSRRRGVLLCGRFSTQPSASTSAPPTASRRSDPTRSSPSRSRRGSESELLVVVATCTNSRARPPQPTHAQHSREPRIANTLCQQMALAAAAPHARPPRTALRLPAAWLFCSTGASRDTAFERERLARKNAYCTHIRAYEHV